MKLDPTFRFAIAAVDAVIFAVVDGKLLTLVRPVVTETGAYKGQYGFPGGIMKPTEDAPTALSRHLKEKAGLRDVYTEQLATFTSVDRDIRSRAVAIAYLGLVPPKIVETYNHPDARWVEVTDVPKLAYDHDEMLAMARKRLASKLLYTTIVRLLLPKQFTLSELQSIYEIVRGEVFDKRNFRKKILTLDIITDTGEVQSGMANRPAALYTFTGKTVIEVSQIAGM
jgi:8-oxo-dGTP diphosphatase